MDNYHVEIMFVDQYHIEKMNLYYIYLCLYLYLNIIINIHTANWYKAQNMNTTHKYIRTIAWWEGLSLANTWGYNIVANFFSKLRHYQAKTINIWGHIVAEIPTKFC